MKTNEKALEKSFFLLEIFYFFILIIAYLVFRRIRVNNHYFLKSLFKKTVQNKDIFLPVLFDKLQIL